MFLQECITLAPLILFYSKCKRLSRHQGYFVVISPCKMTNSLLIIVLITKYISLQILSYR